MNKSIRIILIIVVIAISSAIIRTISKDSAKSTTSPKNDVPANNNLNDSLKINTSNQSISEQLWFKNPQHGLSFETPYTIVAQTFTVPQGTEEYIKKGYSYYYTDNDYGIKYVVLEINPKIDNWDTQEGLRGAVGNFINGWKNGGGSQLNLQFSDVKNSYNDKICEGTFLYLGNRMKLKGYCLFYDHKLYTLIGTGEDNNNLASEKLNRTFKSIYVVGDKSSQMKSEATNAEKVTAPVSLSSEKQGHNKLSSLFLAPNCYKNAEAFIGVDKSKIINDFGKNYTTTQTDDGTGIIYYNSNIVGISPNAFLFVVQGNTCAGIVMYFDFAQLHDVMSYMNLNFEEKTPPSNVKVSFLKAWMDSKNGGTYLWKLTKTDNLFFLSLRMLR